MTQKARCLSWWQILLLGFLSRTWLILGFYSGCKTANTTPSLQLRRRSSQCSPWNQYTFCGICTSPRMIWLRKPQCHTPTKFQLGLTCLWKRCFGLMFIVLCCVNDVPRIQYADLFYLVLIANVATISETKKPWTPTASHHALANWTTRKKNKNPTFDPKPANTHGSQKCTSQLQTYMNQAHWSRLFRFMEYSLTFCIRFAISMLSSHKLNSTGKKSLEMTASHSNMASNKFYTMARSENSLVQKYLFRFL